ncbi:MAG: pimeloyl-[acyl-carrier protein] synthase [Alteromonadaceae bacterium]|jgi:pimeloyl-[acyl-carrier protein] synthase
MNNNLAVSETQTGSQAIVLLDPEVLRKPYSTYEQLRREEPVYWSEEIKHWVITRYEDVTSVLRNYKQFSNKRAHTVILEEHRALMNPFIDKLAMWMSFTDPKEHTQVRSLMNEFFTAKKIKAMQPRIQSVIDSLLLPLLQNGELDLVKDFAFPLPAIVISEILGSDIADRDLIKQWCSDIAVVAGVTADINALQTGQQSVLAITEYYKQVIDKRRQQPTDDLISKMLFDQNSQIELDDEQIAAQCIMTILAGHETTQNLIASGIYSLSQAPDQWEQLRQDPSLLDTAIQEFARFESPLQGLTRIATETVQLRDKTIKKGDSVMVFLGSANRDESMFKDPDQLIISRSRGENRHIAFGVGVHLCIGVSVPVWPRWRPKWRSPPCSNTSIISKSTPIPSGVPVT